MYLDPRLWALTRGVRLRIAATVLVGLAAVAVGIARLVLLGWLLARVLHGESLAALAGAIALTAAAVVVRSALDYARTMMAHHTAARVQARLREILYEQIVTLGPAHFAGARTAEVMLSLVEGVQQLETYFGQYLPQLFVAALTPVLVFLMQMVEGRVDYSRATAFGLAVYIAGALAAAAGRARTAGAEARQAT